MIYAIKKQLKDYQLWIDLASMLEDDTIKSISRFDFVTFIAIFITTLFSTFILYQYHLNLTLAALILHLFLGYNMLKARTLVANSLDNLNNHEQLAPDVAKFLNKEYSLFLLSQGKKPLSQEQIENLEVHKQRFVKEQMTRAGRADSIRRFRLAFLKREKIFFDVLFMILICIEFFIIF